MLTALMTPSVNTETVGLTISHEWTTVVFHDVYNHTSLLERET